MHAVSQGALGVECRRDDLTVIKMLNRLNDETTLLRCIAERTFMAKLEGGCSAPIAVTSGVTENSIWLEGAVFDLEGTRRIQDKFEIKFDQDNTCPVVNIAPSKTTKNSTSIPASTSTPNKRKLNEDESEEDEQEPDGSKKLRVEDSPPTSQATPPNMYSFIMDLNIKECKMVKSELCGLHLAEKLKEKGAEVLINQIKAQINTNF